MYLEAPLLYPNLLRLAQSLAKRIPTNKRILDAFKFYGEFTTQQATKALQWGPRPEIQVRELAPNVWGTTTRVIQLNQRFIDQFEDVHWTRLKENTVSDLAPWQLRQRRREWQQLVDRADLSIEALILHEIVHWGDTQTYAGSPNSKPSHEDAAADRAGFGDRGHQFVHAAYGARFAYVNDSRGKAFADHGIKDWLGADHLGGNMYRYREPPESLHGRVRPPRGRTP